MTDFFTTIEWATVEGNARNVVNGTTFIIAGLVFLCIFLVIHSFATAAEKHSGKEALRKELANQIRIRTYLEDEIDALKGDVRRLRESRAADNEIPRRVGAGTCRGGQWQLDGFERGRRSFVAE